MLFVGRRALHLGSDRRGGRGGKCPGAAVAPSFAEIPAGFADVTPFVAQGTIYPDLIDLHNP